MRAKFRHASLTHSHGFALIAGLLLLASMMILGLAVATGVLLERRMAGNFADQRLALDRARLAGQWARYWLQSRTEDPLASDCSEACGPSPPMFSAGQLPPSPELEAGAWWRLNGVEAGLDPVSGDLRMDYSLNGTEAPLWLIEELHMEPLEGIAVEPGDPEPKLGYYRVLARGSGRFPGSIAVTESVVAMPWAAPFDVASYPPTAEAMHFCDQVPPEISCGRIAWQRRR
jgi:Tfp pilus assembly protein PilX